MVSAVQSQLTNAQLAPVAIGSQISASVAAKVLSAEKEQGAAVVNLIDAAASVPEVATPANGPGSLVDISA